jgi:hypothetical protein
MGGLGLGQAAFPVTAAGCRRLTGWLRGFGVVDRVGVEVTGAMALATPDTSVDCCQEPLRRRISMSSAPTTTGSGGLEVAGGMVAVGRWWYSCRSVPARV